MQLIDTVFVLLETCISFRDIVRDSSKMLLLFLFIILLLFAISSYVIMHVKALRFLGGGGGDKIFISNLLETISDIEILVLLWNLGHCCKIYSFSFCLRLQSCIW
mgnify:CR=1 FL=1